MSETHLVAHQFEQPEQQAESVSLGMWAFLATEVLFFGALFAIYSVYRFRYPEAWLAGSHELDVVLGGINTGALLLSSLTMAMGVHAAKEGNRKQLIGYLIATIVLACVFLGIKSVEYKAKYDHGFMPGPTFNPQLHAGGHPSGGHPTEGPPRQAETSHGPGNMGHETPGAQTNMVEQRGETYSKLGPVSMDDRTRHLRIFFSLYFAMTGLHAFHILIGVVILAGLVYLSYTGWINKDYNSPIEMTGLYWHFVDIVWVFLFPLIYLIDRSML